MSQTPAQIEEAIWQTIAFFDIFSYPLTLLEVWQYCPLPLPGIEAASRALASKSRQGKIESKQGFYFLPGRQEIVAVRQRRFNYSQDKIKRARRLAKIFRFIPWVKFIAVGNNIGSFNLRAESDIDLFIITSRQRIWLARLFCVGLSIILGVRPTKQNKKDTICLSFYVAEDGLALAKFLLPAVGGGQTAVRRRDPYFLFWLAGLLPILDRGGWFEKLLAANSWLKAELPNWQKPHYFGLALTAAALPAWYEQALDRLLGGLETIAELIQLHIMPGPTRKMLDKDTRVVANSQVIKLHTNDRRQQFCQEFQEKISLNKS